MKAYDYDYGYAEELTSRKETANFIKEYREAYDNEVCGEDVLYIEYKNGSTLLLSGGESMEDVRLTNIVSMTLDAEYGTTFYNAELTVEKNGTDNPDFWELVVY